MIGIGGCFGKKGTLLKSHLGHSRVAGQVVVSAICGILDDTPEPMEHTRVVANVVRENLVISTEKGETFRPRLFNSCGSTIQGAIILILGRALQVLGLGAHQPEPL